MMSVSGTSSPASMKRLASTPSGEPAFTAARSMSPVEICGMPNFSLMKVAWVPLPAPGAPNRIKRMVISPNRIETAALRGLSGIRSLWRIARLGHPPVKAANEARRAEFKRRRGTSRHGRSGALALTGRLALPIDYAMHRHNRGSNPRLENPASGGQRGVTRVDRRGAAAVGGVENEPISRGAVASGRGGNAGDRCVSGGMTTELPQAALLQHKRGLCVVYDT